MGYDARRNPYGLEAMLKRSLVLATACLLAACATLTVDLPAITDAPSGSHDSGRVVWHDLITTTPEASRKFYGELFGWTFEKPGVVLGFGGDDSYMLIRHNGQLIGGMFDATELDADENVSQWVTILSTDDVDAAVARAETAGAEVTTPPTQLASRGRLAVLRDPEGALFALLTAKGGDPAPAEPVLDGFLWSEVWTSDVGTTTQFYEDVLGVSRDAREIPGMDDSYMLLMGGGEPRAGVLDNPFENERPVWVNYLRVADPAAVTARVEALGGRIIIDAQPRDIGGKVAFIAGPSGAGIALQTWPLEANP